MTQKEKELEQMTERELRQYVAELLQEINQLQVILNFWRELKITRVARGLKK